jgi:hypothetical protein
MPEITKEEMLSWLSGMLYENLELCELQTCKAIKSLIESSGENPPYSKADVEELVKAVKDENDMTGYDNLESEQLIRTILQKKQAVLDVLSKFKKGE